MRAQSLAATASAGVSHDPPQTFTFGKARNCGAVTREAGPVKGGTTVIAFVTDPDGYKVELIERQESSS